jgi:maleate isomerase
MWQPDGWGQTRIGVLTPHADIVPETEFNAPAPDGVSIHAARIPFGGYRPDGGMEATTIADDPVRAIADPPAVDDAAEMLAMAPIRAIVFGFTSSSYVRGAADDAALKARLEARTRGIPVVIPCAAAATALIALSAKKVALVSPPWFSVGMAQQGESYFHSQGVEIVYSAALVLPTTTLQPSP